MAKSDCDKCLHYDQRRGALDDSPCLIARCPLVIRDEALEDAYKLAKQMYEDGDADDVADAIRAMKGER